MKRCPKCRRRYSDDSLSFCLDDGFPLAPEPDSDPTLISPSVPLPFTVPSAGIPYQPPQSSPSSNRWVLMTLVIILAVMLGGGAVAFFYQISKGSSTNNENNSRASQSTPERKLSINRADQVRPSPTAEPAPANTKDLTGDWNMVNTIENTSYPAYANLRIGYHLVINQSGTTFTAEGEKQSENGRPMDAIERTPIHITGSVEHDLVTAAFVEEGLRRKTTGRFQWIVISGGNQLQGTFASGAAKSSGSSVATRER